MPPCKPTSEDKVDAAVLRRRVVSLARSRLADLETIAGQIAFQIKHAKRELDELLEKYPEERD